MSLVIYNDIALPYPLTTRFVQEPVYDEESGTDWYCTKFTIQVQCVLNIEYLEAISEQFAGITDGNASSVMNLIRVKLEEPRKLLSFSNNGVELIPAQAGTVSTVDARNGPRPISCQIMEMNAETFLLTYIIEAHYWEKYNGTNRTTNLPGSPVLYNRWSETVEIDEYLMSRRTREGKYVIRSDNSRGVTADEMRRDMAVLGCPAGFRRTLSRYTIDPSGLGIRYTIQDTEQYKMPPQYAYKAVGQYTLTTPKPGGTLCYGEVRLQLWGAKSSALSPQTKLLAVAIALCVNKLGINGASQLQSASVTVDMFENIVTVNMRALCNAAQATYQGLALSQAFLQNLCYTPGVDNDSTSAQQQRIVYLPRGSAGLLLQAAAHYDPNLNNARLVAGVTSTSQDNFAVAANVNQLNTGVETGQG